MSCSWKRETWASATRAQVARRSHSVSAMGTSSGWIALVVAVGSLGCIDTSGLVFDRGGSAGGGANSGAKTYSQVVLDDAPAGYWRLGEDSTMIAADSSGLARDALYFEEEGTILRAQPGALAGDPDGAAVLSGNATIIIDPHPFSFGDLAPYSLEAWVRADAEMDGYEFTTCMSGGTPSVGYTTHFTSESIYHKRYSDTSSNSISQQPSVFSLEYRHVVVTFDGDSAQLYLDAVPLRAAPMELALLFPVHGGPFYLAHSFGQGSFAIDEVAVYDHALDLARIEAHHDCGKNQLCQ
jgi:hypothetical protein